MAHDVFPFGSRRVLAADLPVDANAEGATDDDEAAFDRLSAQHEHVLAKSLLCAGVTMPGLVMAEDVHALDLLAARPDVDPSRTCQPFDGRDHLGESAERVQHAVIEVEVAHQMVEARRLIRRRAEEDGRVAEDLLQKRIVE